MFLRKIVEGGTDKSYGIQVARLAGVPKEVLERAKVNPRATSKNPNSRPKATCASRAASRTATNSSSSPRRRRWICLDNDYSLRSEVNERCQRGSQ